MEASDSQIWFTSGPIPAVLREVPLITTQSKTYIAWCALTDDERLISLTFSEEFSL